MYSRVYQRQERNKTKTPHSLTNLNSGMLQGHPLPVQLKTLSQQPDLKTSLSRAERYGHHLDKIQCAGLSTVAPIQMLSADEEEKRKLTSSMDLKINKLNNTNKLPEEVLSVASGLTSYTNHKDIKIEQKQHFYERNKSATKTSNSKDKAQNQNSDERLTSPTINKISDNKATEESSLPYDPEVNRLLNKPTQSNLAVSGGGTQEKSQQKNFITPPSTYNDYKNTVSKKVGSRGQYLAKREAMDMLGNNKEFATTQRAVKFPVTNTPLGETSKGEDSKQQVKLKNAAELVRDQVINEDRQVKEHVRGTLNLDPAIIAKQGGENLILQKVQKRDK